MTNSMFCFQCEQTAGCAGCTGCAGVCGKTAETANLQDELTGALIGLARAKEAEAIVPFVKDKIEEYREAGNPVFFTRDTHGEDYLDTQEGKNLPVKHCIEGTWGWQISDEIGFSEDDMVFDKNTFGYDWSQAVLAQPELFFGDEIELIGLCTDICVISNAMGLKTVFPETVISVDAACCAGVTKESHETALASMKMCQIQIKNSH